MIYYNIWGDMLKAKQKPMKSAKLKTQTEDELGGSNASINKQGHQKTTEHMHQYQQQIRHISAQRKFVSNDGGVCYPQVIIWSICTLHLKTAASLDPQIGKTIQHLQIGMV